MKQIRIAPIVEGHGEVIAVRKLLERIWYEIVGGEHIDVLKPIRQRRSKLLRHNPQTGTSVPAFKEFNRAIRLAVAKLREKRFPDIHGMVLLLLDAERDCPKAIIESLRSVFSELPTGIDLAIILPCVEYETWFVAAADSLSNHLGLSVDDLGISDAENRNLGKSWIKERANRYSETIDQIRFTAAMDLSMCRARSPSFDKLCRELEQRAAGGSHSSRPTEG